MIFEKNLKIFDFYDITTPFCYALTKPLGVPTYAVGFGLSVPKHFFLSPNKAVYFLYTAFLRSELFLHSLTILLFTHNICFLSAVPSEYLPSSRSQTRKNRFALFGAQFRVCIYGGH